MVGHGPTTGRQTHRGLMKNCSESTAEKNLEKERFSQQHAHLHESTWWLHLLLASRLQKWAHCSANAPSNVGGFREGARQETAAIHDAVSGTRLEDQATAVAVLRYAQVDSLSFQKPTNIAGVFTPRYLAGAVT